MIFPQIKTFLHALVQFFKRPELAPKSVQDKRYERCRTCPQNDSGQCQICSCYIPIKIMLATEKCPAKKPLWGEYHSRRRNGL